MYLRAWSMAAEPAGLGPMATSSRRSAHARLESNLGAAAACTAARAIALTSLVVIFSTGAGAPPPARTDADTEPRSHTRCGRGRSDWHRGPNPQREVTL